MPEEQYKQLEESGSSGSWDNILETGLTKSQADDKIIQEKQILTFDQDGSVSKVPTSKIKKKSLTKKALDFSSLNIGYYILVPIVGGVALGVFLDKYFKTQPVFIGIFLFLGTIAGFYNLFKLMQE